MHNEYSVYKFVLKMDHGSLEVNFRTDKPLFFHLPFVLKDFYYSNLQFSEKQINCLDSIVGRDFQNSYPNWVRFSISEIKVHTINF